MNTILSSVCALILVAVSSAADAHANVNTRQARQTMRISIGMQRGLLTPIEAARLGAQQSRIRHIESHYRADGYLGPYERADLQRRLDRSSGAIRWNIRDRQRW